MASVKGRASAIFNFSAGSGSSLAAVFAFNAGFDGFGVLAACVAAVNLIAGAHTVWKLRHTNADISHGSARTPD